MAQVANNDLDYLAARLHGRRSRMAEADRLESLCGLPSLPELNRAVHRDTEFHAVADFQRRLAHDLVRELVGFLKHLDGPGADLLSWMLVRFQVENIKVLVRAFVHRTPLAAPEEYLLSLPRDFALNVQALLSAKSLEEFTALLPAGAPRNSLRQTLGVHHNHPRPFFLEAALDRGYLQELLNRVERLSGEDNELIKPIVFHEVDTFNLMLLVRGLFHYGLASEVLLPLRVRRDENSGVRFSARLATTHDSTRARVAEKRLIDALPSDRGFREASATVDPPALEALAWRRSLRLSNLAFRRSHTGLAALIGYVGIRRVEVANLITLSEGIRLGAAADRIHARLIPRADLESVYV